MSASLCFVAATLLAGQGDLMPIPVQPGAPVVQQSTGCCGGAQAQQVVGPVQRGQVPPSTGERRGLFARFGGWLSGLFGKSRQADSGGMPAGEVMVPQAQQPVHFTEPPLAQTNPR